MIKSIDHIGIAVKSLEQAVPLYERAFGLRCSAIETVAGQNVRTAFFPVGGVRIELLEATSPDSPIARFIERRGEGVHHVALQSNAVDDDINTAVTAGCMHLDQVGVTGAGGSQVAFLHPRGLCGVLVELCGNHMPDSPPSGQPSAKQ